MREKKKASDGRPMELTFEKCKGILNRNKMKYTNEQVEQIRQFLYQIAEIDYQIYQTLKRDKRIKVSEN